MKFIYDLIILIKKNYIIYIKFYTSTIYNDKAKYPKANIIPNIFNNIIFLLNRNYNSYKGIKRANVLKREIIKL